MSSCRVCGRWVARRFISPSGLCTLCQTTERMRQATEERERIDRRVTGSAELRLPADDLGVQADAGAEHQRPA